MILCLCRAVSDKKVLAVVVEGASSVREVTARCGAGGDCGACRAAIAGMIMEQRRTAGADGVTAGAGAQACASGASPVVEVAA